LELLKDAVPKLSRVAVFTSATATDDAQVLKEIEIAAGPLGVNLRYLDIRSPNDFENSIPSRSQRESRAGSCPPFGLPRQSSENTDCRTRSKEPVASNVRTSR